MKKWILGLVLAISVPAMACDIDGLTGFAPENDLNISTDHKSINGIDEAEFNAVIDEIKAIYEPIIKKNRDKLVINRKWADGTVNASAMRRGRKVIVNMYGGLARHNLITRDGFAIVMCHELGHHLGGAPTYAGFGRNWASNEGQSDYFATLKCFRKVYLNDNNIEKVNKMDIDPVVETQCDAQWSNLGEAALCKRSAMAAKSTADLLASLRRSDAPKFETPDSNVVSRTNDGHPAAQCRLDTYFAGALCDKDMNTDVDSKDPVIGTCTRTDGYNVGMRSLCWYAPKK